MTIDIAIFAAVCIVVAHAVTDIIDSIVWILKGETKPDRQAK